MLPAHVALTTNGTDVSSSQLTKVAAALTKQVMNDFGPTWNVTATIDSFVALEDVPIDYWPVIVQPNVQGAAGYHEDENGQPFAVVEYTDDWSLTASHECLEMLADPFGRRLKAGNVPDQAVAVGIKPGRVQFLVEVCDPSEDGKYSYQVNGIAVSDFYTPKYFDPVKAAGVRYSFTGAIEAPRSVLPGGYLSWRDPISKHWMQLRMFPDDLSKKSPHVVDLSDETVFARELRRTNIRAAVDRVTPKPPPEQGIARAPKVASRPSADRTGAAQAARAASLRAQIQELTRAGRKKANDGER